MKCFTSNIGFPISISSDKMDKKDLPLKLDELAVQLKNTNREKFLSLCRMHLSFLLDLSGGDLEELLGNPAEYGISSNFPKPLRCLVKRWSSTGRYIL